MLHLSSPEALALVFLLGGIGALTRYAVLVVSAHAAGPFPAGILVVNTLAAFIGSALVSARAPEELLLIIGGGFVGSERSRPSVPKSLRWNGSGNTAPSSFLSC